MHVTNYNSNPITVPHSNTFIGQWIIFASGRAAIQLYELIQQSDQLQLNSVSVSFLPAC